MAETPLADVIRYLRTRGGTDGVFTSYSDQPLISFGTGAMSTVERAYAQLAFALWGDLVEKSFVLGGTDSNIVLNYSTDLDDSEAGLMRTSFTFGLDHHRDVLINRNTFGTRAGVDFDNVVFAVYLHEIGHALGLTHPGKYNGAGSLVYGEDNVYPEDTNQYTLMSYFFSGDGFRLGDGGSSTPMLHDIAAIQSIYGADMNTRTGDTIYGFGSNNERRFQAISMDPYDFAEQPGGFAFAIWDAGGIDTIDASQFRVPGVSAFGGRFPDQTIDLRAGQFSSIGISTAATSDPARSISNVLKNNVAIAYGVTIENAIGGDGNDEITGNDADNRLVGNDGTDTLLGGRGNDTLIGGDDSDTLRGEDDNDTLDGGNGSDRLFGGDGDDILIGGMGERDQLFGGTGFDTVRYTDAGGVRFRPSLQSFSGSAAGDFFSSIEAFDLTPGKDSFEGRDDERDRIYGNDGDDELLGLGGNDLLHGGPGDDTLYGGADDDTLYGWTGNDKLFGGDGNDLLDGDIGADEMSGGPGNDTYFVKNVGDIVIEPLVALNGRTGIDVVYATIDYTLTAGVENLRLEEVGDFGALRATGNALANELEGNSRANILDGAGGADTMRGLRGNDTYVVDNVGDVVDETDGASSDVDTVQSSVSFSLSTIPERLGPVTTIGAIENLSLTGTSAINGSGNGLDNELVGNGADNVLTGQAGDDTLRGGGGNDTLNGGTDNDTYDFRVGVRSSVNLGSDTISDSSGSDLLRIDNLSQIVGARRSGSDAIVTLSQGTVTIKNHFAKGEVEKVRADSKEVVLAVGLIGGPASGIISGSDDAELLDGRAGDDLLYGAGGDDTLLGDEGHDLLDGGAGNDSLDGGAGRDTARFGGLRAEYDIARGAGTTTISDRVGQRDGIDSLVSIERYGFADGTLAFDGAGTAGAVYGLYQAILERAPDAGGLGFFVSLADEGSALASLASSLLTSAEFAAVAKPAGAAAVIDGLYVRLLGRQAEAQGQGYWTARLASEPDAVDAVIADFVGTAEAAQRLAGVFADGVWFG